MMKRGFHIQPRKDMPIRNKLIWISLITIGAVLLLIATALILSEILTFRSEIIDDITAKAGIIGENSKAAITFYDNDAARDTLKALTTSPNIVHAIIYTKDFDVLARYSRSDSVQAPSPIKSEGYIFGINSFDMLRKIVLDNQLVGYVYIQADLGGLYFQLAWHGLTILFAIGLSIFIAYFMISRMQESITIPIHDLAGLMQEISHAQDYSLRTKVNSSDEIGTLARGFNDMLEQIQKRDAALEQYGKTLEETVSRRTYQLSLANEQLQQELADRKRAEYELKRRDASLDALSYMAERFLNTPDLMQSINENLKLLGKVTEVSRIFIYENHRISGGDLLARRRYEWVARGITPHLNNPDYAELSYSETGLYAKAFGLKQTIHGHVKDFPDLQRVFENFDVKSIIMVPIFVHNIWWGVFGLSQCGHERNWSAAEIDILRTAADILGAAIHRKQVEEQLVKARDAAMEASNTKSLFLASMSHEIRTPMNAIIGFNQLLEKTPVNKTQKEYLHVIRSSADILLDIINSILDFSKIESGKFELETTGFDIRKELEGMIETLSFKANEKNIDLVFLLDPTLPRILSGDSLRIKQVLTNLIGNAIKFTDRGGYVYIKIVLESIDEEARTVNVSFAVEDNGIGISKDKQGSVLEPFTQADCSITREYGGTGLGLAISDNIVAMMGGKLSLESEPGKGARFFFTLGFDVLQEEGGVDPNSMNLNLKVALYGFRREEPSQGSVIRTYLEHLGCSVCVLTDITDLVDIEDVHVLIMLIPPIDIEAIRTSRVITSAPIIAIAREYAAEIMEGSFDKVIYQPAYMSKLVDAIIEVTETELRVAAGNIVRNDSEIVRFNAKVLVAEDVPTNQMLIKLIMGESGIDVDIASNGLEAVEKYRTSSYEAVFMDIHMPVCNGINATKMIREYEQMTTRRRTPIIALTADAIKGEKERLLAAGMDDYITKPIDRETLNAIFRKYIHGDAAGDVSRNSTEPRNAGFDISATVKSLGITEEMARLCLRDFFSSVDDDLDEFRTNLEARNRTGICEVAHKMKGTAANLRIDGIADLCREAESIAKGGLTVDDITVLNDKIVRIAALKNNLWDMVGRQ